MRRVRENGLLLIALERLPAAATGSQGHAIEPTEYTKTLKERYNELRLGVRHVFRKNYKMEHNGEVHEVEIKLTECASPCRRQCPAGALCEANIT